MAYKRNPMRSERIAGLARFAQSLEPNANQTHSVQYFERTLDDSANRRLVLPESFLAADAILVLMGNVASGLEVHPARIRQRVEDELPFMATEELIVRAVQAGGDRQGAHETIRRHSMAAARAVKDGARRNDLLDRLAGDPTFPAAADDLRHAVDPRRYVGRAAEQVDDFLSGVVDPVLAGEDAVSDEAMPAGVRV
jgi:adenylosuccinate lyase